MPLTVCATCSYPHEDDGQGCPNPACFANPSMTDDTKQRHLDEGARRKEEEDERAKFRRIRERAMAPTAP